MLTGLNFNSGVHGQVDNDFFVMAIPQGVTYTCQTRDLGPSVDTNLILYWSAGVSYATGGRALNLVLGSGRPLVAVAFG